MTYHSDVEEGGWTVFPKMNLVVKPVKGTAVYWRNMKTDGTVLPNTLHGGCPVLIGHKKVIARDLDFMLS